MSSFLAVRFMLPSSRYMSKQVPEVCGGCGGGGYVYIETKEVNHVNGKKIISTVFVQQVCKACKGKGRL